MQALSCRKVHVQQNLFGLLAGRAAGSGDHMDRIAMECEAAEKALRQQFGDDQYDNVIKVAMEEAKAQGLSEDDLSDSGQGREPGFIARLFREGQMRGHIKADQERDAAAQDPERDRKRRILENKMKDKRYCGGAWEKDELFIEEVTRGFQELYNPPENEEEKKKTLLATE